MESLLTDLVRFQKRQYLAKPTLAKARRRYICGIKECTKKLDKLKLLVLAKDVRKSIPMVVEDFSLLVCNAESRDIPVVFALNRRRLAYACQTMRNKTVCCVGIMNYQGKEETVKEILDLLPDLRKGWQEAAEAGKPKDSDGVGGNSDKVVDGESESVGACVSKIVGGASSTKRALPKGKKGVPTTSSLEVSQKILALLKEDNESS